LLVAFSQKKDNNRAPKGEYTPIRIIKNDAPLRARKSDEALNDEDNNYHYNTAINNLVEMVIPRVVSTFQSMLYVEAPTDPVDLRNRQENCGNVNLPEDPMLNGDFYIIFDGVRDSDEEICRKNKNLAGISQACSFDLWPFNPRAGKSIETWRLLIIFFEIVTHIIAFAPIISRYHFHLPGSYQRR
jgi:hypothetical protein